MVKKIGVISHIKAIRRANSPVKRSFTEIGYKEGYYMKDSPLSKNKQPQKPSFIKRAVNFVFNKIAEIF